MMYPFLQIVHSEMLPDGEVKVYIAEANKMDGSYLATCFLLGYLRLVQADVGFLINIVEIIAHIPAGHAYGVRVESAGPFRRCRCTSL